MVSQIKYRRSGTCDDCGIEANQRASENPLAVGEILQNQSRFAASVKDTGKRDIRLVGFGLLIGLIIILGRK